ncbi:hypothetical protein Pme01_34300 [Planosporangium mesophilum]|uniref:Uncharacterized protein n=1 Tax=Planosporangium mesophilum TaxID=689768 RepID=A0A8J3TCA3_9ACTN|nr:hypothetical protein Pme01_34300 [Planosporangium mesophilum]
MSLKTRPWVVRAGETASAAASSAGNPTKSSALSARPVRTAITKTTRPKTPMSPAKIQLAVPGRENGPPCSDMFIPRVRQVEQMLKVERRRV